MPRVLVADPIANEGIERLRAAADVDVLVGLSVADLIAVIGKYDGLIVRSETKVTADVLAAAARMRVIGRAGVGVDNIDVRSATERGVVVVNSPQGNTTAAAELSVAMMLALARKIPQADASMRAGRWERNRFLGTEVYGKTLGIIGLGKIGAEVSRRSRAFGMVVLAYDPYATGESAAQCGARLSSLDDVIEKSDFISLHVPLNDRTRGIIGASQIARMRDGVRIINCARGGLVDEAALAAAVRGGKVAGAAIDVFVKEPPGGDDSLVALEEVVVTPHLGASTAEAQVNVAIDVAEQILDVFQGRPARSAVNMPAVSVEAYTVGRPYLVLGERMGLLQTQLSRDLDGCGHPIERIEVTFCGEFGEVPTGSVTRAVLAGVLAPMLSDPVNMVNAPVLAAARGIKVVETNTTAHEEYSAVLLVRASTPAGACTISGAVFGQNDIRIVSIDGYRMNIVPEGVLLVTRHSDKPGMIGRVGTLLGSAGVNIAGMSLGREKFGGIALMVLMVDDPIPEAVMADIRSLQGMETAQVVSFL